VSFSLHAEEEVPGVSVSSPAFYTRNTTQPLSVSAKLALDALGLQILSVSCLALSFVFLIAVARLLLFLTLRSGSRPVLEDVHEVRKILRNLDIFRVKARGAKKGDLGDLSFEFVRGIMKAACNAICHGQDIRASLMIEQQNRLILADVWPPVPGADWSFSPSLPTKPDRKRKLTPKDQVGVAGFAFLGLFGVYVPNVLARKGYWVSWAQSGRIEFSEIGSIWLESDAASRYQALLSAPVFIQKPEDEFNPWGVLNIECETRDPFGDADFHLACVFARVLAQAFEITRSNYSST